MQRKRRPESSSVQTARAKTTNEFSYQAPIQVLDKDQKSINEADRLTCIEALESGQVIQIPRPSFPFELSAREQNILGKDLVDPKRKNISFNPEHNRVMGVADHLQKTTAKTLLLRYYNEVLQLITNLFPHYIPHLRDPVNSLRVHEVSDWQNTASWRKDDRRIHVDAFPSRPVHGNRILRVFTNINPHGLPRRWRIGEPFPDLAKRLFPRLKPYSSFSAWLQSKLKITKSRRTHYDHLMLGLHDAMKADEDYQQQSRQWDVAFHPGSTWICYSDQVAHAAVSGQFMLEQTFLVDIAGMQHIERSPLKVLEKLARQTLI